MAKETEITRGLEFPTDSLEWGFKGNNYLLVIGIDNYHHWPKLHCAVKDVEDFSKLLMDRYQFFGEHVFRLLEDRATEQNILIELRNIAKLITAADNLIVYFSGHGHYDEDTNSGFWIPVDARLGNDFEYEFLDTAIIAHRIKGIASLHTFLIIDACFSGTMVTQLRSAPKSERYKSRRILTSGRAEVVSDGPVGGNSPFAEGILMALNKNEEPHLRASKLMVDVIDYVERQSRQTPTMGTLFNSGDEGGEFVFHLVQDEEMYWKFTQGRNTIAAYENYIAAYPEGSYLKQARSKIENLKSAPRGLGPDALAWMKLPKNAGYKDYLVFTDAYPESEFSEIARTEMTFMDNKAHNDLLKMEAVAAIPLADKIRACEAYFENFPKGRHTTRVRQLRNRLNFLR